MDIFDAVGQKKMNQIDRITYIESAKGLCMLLVVISHTGATIPIPGLFVIHGLLFFLLSGYVFNENTLFKDFVRNRTKTLLIPFLIFYLISYILLYILKFVYAGYAGLTSANGILDIFTQKQWFNGPIWFLLSLFCVQIIVKTVSVFIKSTIAKFVIFIGCFFLGWWLSKYNIFLPFHLDTTLTCIIYYAFGISLRKSNIVERIKGWHLVITLILLYSVYLIYPVGCRIATNTLIAPNAFIFLVSTLSMCLAILMLCKSLLDWSFLRYIGKHTMFILCTHHLIYRPIKILIYRITENTNIGNWLIFAITIMTCLILAPYFEKNIPVAFGKIKTNENS